MLFERGIAEALPLDDATIDLVWCRDVLVHVAALDRAYAEIRRVLREDGRAFVYQSSFATDRLESHEAAWLWKSLDIIPTSADPARAEQAITIAGLAINGCSEVGIESGEWSEEQAGAENRQLLHAARLLHAKEHYIAQFGQVAYDIMLADCLWRVYRKNGKLGGRVYILSRG